MMGGVNKAIIIGTLGQDPDVQIVKGNQAVAYLHLATSDSWVDREGIKQERVEWHQIVVWGKLAEICGRKLSKGREIYVEGKIQSFEKENSSGSVSHHTEIVAQNIYFLGRLEEEA